MQNTKSIGFARLAGTVFAGAVLPFLAAIAWGTIFDSRGGEPFAVTVFGLFLLSPLWILIGVGCVIACYLNPTAMKAICIADAVLFRAGLRAMLHQRVLLVVVIPLLAFVWWSTFTLDENREQALPLRIIVATLTAGTCVGVGILCGVLIVAAQSFLRRDKGVLGEHTLELGHLRHQSLTTTTISCDTLPSTPGPATRLRSGTSGLSCAIPRLLPVANVRQKMERSLKEAHTDMLRFALLALVVCCGCSNLQFRQASEAMSPTIKPNEIVTGHISYFRRVVPRRWEVVVFIAPSSTNENKQVEFWGMRVVGLPGERINIQGDGIYIDGKRQDQPEHISDIRYAPTVEGLTAVSYPYEIALNSYFLLGDNTTNSVDSRVWGSLHGSSIVGRIKGK